MIERRRRIVLILSILSVFFYIGVCFAIVEDAPEGKPQEKTKPTYVAGELIVKLKDKLDESKVSSLDFLNQKYGVISIEKVFKETLSKNKETRPVEYHQEWYWYLDKGLTKEKKEDTNPTPTPQQNQQISKPNLPNLSNIFILKVPKHTDILEMAKEYSQDPNVEYAQPNYIVKVQVIPNDPYYSLSGSWGQPYADLWGLKKIQCEQAWDTSKGENVVVAVVDTGVDYNHQDIASNIWINQDEVPGNGRDDDNNGFVDDVRGWDFIGDDYRTPQPDNDPMDVYGHGTHVSGTIAALTNNGIGVAGVTWFSKIMPVRGLDSSGYGPDSQLAQCLIYAADNGADIINNSWGGEGDSQLITDAVRYAYNLGCVVVAAAGNENSDAKNSYPANIKEAMAVSAFNYQDQRCSFSNYGVKIDVAAPGGGIDNELGGGWNDIYNILSTMSDNSSLATELPDLRVGAGYWRLAGTSMACPHVSGVAALVLSKHPEFSNEEVRQVLRVSSDDVDAPGWDKNSGYGRINAYRAVQVNSVCIASFNSPLQYSSVKGTIDVLGRAKGVNFKRYFLEYGQSDSPTNWTQIGSISYSQVTNGILTPWDTTYINDGQYTLKLVVEDTQGRRFEDRIVVNIDNFKTNISLPENYEVLRLGDNLTIKGDAWSEGFQEYLVEYSPDDGLTWSLIKRGTSSVLNGILAVWDTSNLPNEAKEYQIRLTTRGQHLEDKSKIMVYLDPTLHQGWPKNLTRLLETQGMYESWLSRNYAPAVCDINADGKKEIIVLCPSMFDSKILIFDSESNLINSIIVPAAIKTPLPTIADIDNDGVDEVLVYGIKYPKEDWTKPWEHWVFAYKYDGSQVKGWPCNITRDGSGGYFSEAPLVVKDLNLDGKTEVIVFDMDGRHYDGTNDIYHYYIYVLNNEGKILAGWPKGLFNKEWQLDYYGDIWSSPFVGNFDNDPELEVGIGMPHPDAQHFVNNSKDGIIYLFNLDGSAVLGWPVELIDYDILGSSIAVGDINNDGKTELVVNAHRKDWLSSFKVFCFENTGRILSDWPGPEINSWYPFSPALGDIDRDRDLEIFARYEPFVYYYFWHHNGQEVQNTGTVPGEGSSSVVADIDGDGSIDWLDATPSSSYSAYTYIVNYNLGRQKILSNFPKRMKRSPFPFISICDLDNDGKIEIVSKSPTDIYVWDLETNYNPKTIEWFTFCRDFQRTGLYLSYRTPSILPIGNKTVYEGKLLEFTLIPADLGRAQDWIYNTQSLPSGASFNYIRRTFSWIPNFNQVGNYTVTFSVSDGMESSSQTINIRVLNSILEGRVIGSDGLPVIGAIVYIKKQGNIVAQTRTEADGRYVIDVDLSSGDYQIEIKADGYLPYTQDISLTQGQTSTLESLLNLAYTRVKGYQLIVQKKLPDGTFSPSQPYKIKGVCWSPASIGNPGWDNIAEREGEFANWYKIDIPLMKQMGVNTVRTFLDFGADDVTSGKILDKLYENGIMAIMSVDDGLNDTANLEHVVQVFKDHPAILMWEIGNEWNLNFYYGKFSDLDSAGRATESAARRIKDIDPSHPVSSTLGDTGVYNNYPYPACQIQRIVDELCPSIDVWGLNLYRGNTFVDLFTQWASISSKPFYISEFGTDSYDYRIYAENQQMQADWNALLWDEIYFNFSADNLNKTCLGGTVFEWNDEWWKQNYYNPWNQDTSGNYMPGHPDYYANEEWFGITGIGDLTNGRQLKTSYSVFKDRYIKNGVAVKIDTNLKIVSSGAAGPFGPYGVIEFSKNGYPFYHKTGGVGGGRGINVTVINQQTGIIETIRHFDTWADKFEFNRLIDFVNGVENGKILLFGVCDEAGFIDYRTGEPWQNYQEIIEQTYQLLESLGSQYIREVEYWGSWVMISIKGKSTCLVEDYGQGEKTVEVNIVLDTDGDGRTNHSDSDDDNDGLLDATEISRGLDPLDSDTDDDGIRDNLDSNNFSPELSAIGDKIIGVGKTLSFKLDAQDKDANTLIFKTTGLPQGATLDSSTGQFNWTPSASQVGNYIVIFWVSDGQYFDLEKITITVTNQALSVGTIIPSSGTSNPNQTITFTTTYTDPNGWRDIQYVHLLINTQVNGANCFYGYYNQNLNKLYLRNGANTAWLGGYAPGSANTIKNSYAKLDCSQTTVSGSGNTLTVKWAVIFKSAFVGTQTKNTYLFVKDDGGSYAGWTQKGTFLVGPNSTPSVGSISPSSGSSPPNTAVTFTTTYTDPNGWQDIQYGLFLINTQVNGSNCFYGYYNQNLNKLYLRNGANTAWLGGYAPGSSYTIENSYTKLNCASTTVSGSGTTLTVKWNVVFKTPFTGTKNTYLYVKDDTGTYNGWTKVGTRTIQ